jgi:hypothetical protein
MGQTIGRAPMPHKCARFINRKLNRFTLLSVVTLFSTVTSVPRRSMYELWTSYNDIAEGFGLTIEEFSEILKGGTIEYLAVTERTLAPEIDALFRLLDDDEVKIVSVNSTFVVTLFYLCRTNWLML